MIKAVKHNDSKNGDRKQSGSSGNCIVNSRCNANPILHDRIHNSRGKRRDAYGHSYAEYNNCREKGLPVTGVYAGQRSEEHTSELQSLAYLVCRLLLEKKKKYRV